MTATKGFEQTTAHANADLISLEQRARRFWVGLIVCFLTVQLIGGVVTIYLAVGDPTVAVIPNYYQAGLDWDVKRRNMQNFIDLNWTADVTVDAYDAESRTRGLKLVLSRNGHAVEGQRISATLFHHARGNELFRVRMDQAEPGVYVATTNLAQSGLWQFDLSIEGDHGIAETRFAMNIESAGVSRHVDSGSTNPTKDAGR